MAPAAPFQNGSFESPDLLPDGGIQVLPAGDTRISGWMVGGADGSLSWIKNADAWPSYEGKYSIGFEKENPTGGWIEQTFDTVSNRSYRVILAVLGIRFSTNVTWLRAEAFSGAGALILSHDVPLGASIGGQWARMAFSFTATSSLTRLRFTEVSRRQSTIRMDNVSVELEDPSLEIGLYPGIKVHGMAGSTYVLQYQDTLATNSWITLQTLTLNQSPTLLFDTNGLQNPRRVYRVIKQP